MADFIASTGIIVLMTGCRHVMRGFVCGGIVVIISQTAEQGFTYLGISLLACLAWLCQILIPIDLPNCLFVFLSQLNFFNIVFMIEPLSDILLYFLAVDVSPAFDDDF